MHPNSFSLNGIIDSKRKPFRKASVLAENHFMDSGVKKE
jgi:hypothetical protein